MCKYNITSRLARAGDRLVTTRFSYTLTRGFSCLTDPKIAVSLLAGTEVVFDREAEEAGRFLPQIQFTKLGATTARFRQSDLEFPHKNHNVLEFANGKVLPITRLRPGQQLTVLQLPTLESGLVRVGKRNIASIRLSEWPSA